MANKIRYGLSNVYYAIATIDAATNTATYASPVAIPGGVNLSLTPQNDTTPFYADNIIYYVSSATSGYQGDLEVALLPASFEEDVLGNYKDGKDVLMEDANASTVHFALLFQFEGDVKATKHVLYNCTATRANVEGSTKEDNVAPKTETITITAAPIHNATLNKDIIKAKANESSDSTVYSGWFSTVYTGTAVAAQTPGGTGN